MAHAEVVPFTTDEQYHLLLSESVTKAAYLASDYQQTDAWFALQRVTELTAEQADPSQIARRELSVLEKSTTQVTTINPVFIGSFFGSLASELAAVRVFERNAKHSNSNYEPVSTPEVELRILLRAHQIALSRLETERQEKKDHPDETSSQLFYHFQRVGEINKLLLDIDIARRGIELFES